MIDSVEVVSTRDAMAAAEELSERYSLCVGVSSGANFVAARRLREQYKTVLTVFPDGHQKYHSAGLAEPHDATCPFYRWCAKSQLTQLLSQIAGNERPATA
jgi:hypothetical protein